MSISFLDDMIKLSVKKTKWTRLLARTRARKVNGTFEKRVRGHMHEPNFGYHATHPEFSGLIQSS